MDPVSIGVFAAIAGSVATGVGVALAWYLGRQADKSAKAQYKVAALSEASQWLRDFREWASEAVDVLSEAAYSGQETGTGTIHAPDDAHCSHRLGALIDRGRFFLPNIDNQQYGNEKPVAFRGLRHPVLDPLVAAERVVAHKSGLGGYASRSEAVVAMQRLFVSAVQEILGPRQHNREIARIIRDVVGRDDDPTLGGLLPPLGSIPVGAHELLARRSEPPPPKELRS